MLVEKPLIGQTLIVPYMKDANNDILFTMKGIENKFCTDVYGERLHLLTRLKLDSVRKTEVRPIVSKTCGQRVIILCFLNNFVINVDIEPWSHIPCLRHPMTSDWRVFEWGDAKEARC